MLTTLDWVTLGVLLASLVLGAWRGLVYEVVSVAGWVAGFVLAQWFAPEAAKRLPLSGLSDSLRHAAGFVAVFVASLFAAALLAWVTKKLVEAMGMRPVDRTLGAAFGLIRGMVLLLAIVVVVDMTPLKTDAWWREARSVGVLEAVLRGLKPVLPEEFGKYLP